MLELLLDRISRSNVFRMTQRLREKYVDSLLRFFSNRQKHRTIAFHLFANAHFALCELPIIDVIGSSEEVAYTWYTLSIKQDFRQELVTYQA